MFMSCPGDQAELHSSLYGYLMGTGSSFLDSESNHSAPSGGKD